MTPKYVYNRRTSNTNRIDCTRQRVTDDFNMLVTKKSEHKWLVDKSGFVQRQQISITSGGLDNSGFK